jgi:hypothetical protein
MQAAATYAFILLEHQNGTGFTLTPRDFVIYLLIAVVIGMLVSMKSNDKRRKTFWSWFFISLLLTPLAGIGYLIYLFNVKSPRT